MNLPTFGQEDLALRMTYPGFVFRALSNEGYDFKLLLANTGLAEDVLSDPDFQTGLPPLRRFFLNAIEQTGEPHLGIRLAQKFEANFIGLPAYAAVEGQIGFPVRFKAPDIRLILPDALLTRALPGADPLNHRRLLALCDEVAQRENARRTPVGQVAVFLQTGQNLSLPISEVAAALGYSERGLRRQLERAGTTFRTLTNEIRERRARAMLANKAIPIKTIADDLGFDTPSNFARSFKRWTGSSPLAYRRARAGKDGSG